MDEKTLHTLEYPKILEQLAERTAFSASAELAGELRPSGDFEVARQLLTLTSEARRLLQSRPGITIGGARDVRDTAQAARRGVVLPIPDILEVKATLVSARRLAQTFERAEEQFPYLAEIAAQMPAPLGLIDAISQVLTERGEIPDNATTKLANIRRQVRVVHDRLLAKMQRMLSDPKIAPYLQENLITQRDGRYVIPLQADFKGKVKAVVHDQSGSGATLFVEPLSVVELNNEYRQLQLDERDEERRILAALCAQIGSRARDLNWMVETIARLDLIFAQAKYAEDLRAVEPDLKRPGSGKTKSSGEAGALRLVQARHPLLAADQVVPIDMILPPGKKSLVITGPNTGGKTVTLKTVGLLTLMAQSGLHIPVEGGSQLRTFENVFADIGDEQSIEQSLSTFSAHIKNIIRILAAADSESLVLLDELGSGTDPQEGAALAASLLTNLLDRGITTLIATHYPELKTYALGRPDVLNASVEFDIETLQPTYHLIIGLPGSSNALTIAERLGLSPEIVQLARSGLSPDDLRAEDMLAEIHQQRDLIRRTRAEVEKARAEVEKIKADLNVRLAAIEDERRDILEAARQEAEDRLAELDGEVRSLRRRLTIAGEPLEIVAGVAESLSELEDEVAVPVENELREVVAETRAAAAEPLRLGDRVRLRSLGSEGVVTAIHDGEEAEIQIGILRVRAGLDELEKVAGGAAVSGPQSPSELALTGRSSVRSTVQFPSAPRSELDLRGLRVEEALERVTDYLDNAYLANLPFVRIIHGKGTGRLRDAVRKLLRKNENVRSFEAGLDGEGGDGVTVVKFES